MGRAAETPAKMRDSNAPDPENPWVGKREGAGFPTKTDRRLFMDWNLYMNTHGLETLALHAGQTPDSATGSRAVPIYQTTSYVFPDSDEAAKRFALASFGPVYTRLGNPTVRVLEERLAAMHGAAGAVAASSGMAAIFNTVATLAANRQNFVASSNLYGGTVTLFNAELRRFGIEARFIDSSNPANFEKRIDNETRFLYVEAIGNPKGNVDDFEAIAGVAHRHGLPLVMDATFAPPPIFDPIAAGADVVVHSLTKIIGGHGQSLGGVVIENPAFDWKTSGKFPNIAGPDPSYHGVNFWDLFGACDGAVAPGQALTMKIRAGALRNIGACLSPFNAWSILTGLETLPLRAERHCRNARLIAEWLDAHPLVEWVDYAGLAKHPDRARAERWMPMGPGAVFCFGVKGGFKAGKKFLDSVQLLSHLANVLDAKTLVIHPASTTHQQLSRAEQEAAGVRPELIRISVGLERAEDIMKDIDQALRASVEQ